jgi:hypothetical protein
MSKEKLVSIRNTTIYKDGSYELNEDASPVMGGSVWEFNGIVSAQYNQLKGKLYNLVEASVTDEKQREALKGLIKGFCNTAFRNTADDLEHLMYRLGIIEKTFVGGPRLAEPLEQE